VSSFAPFSLLAQAFLKPSNNAIALGAQYQIFFTYVMAFILTADPFVFNDGDKTSLSSLLLVLNLAVFLLAILQASKEAAARADLKAHQEQVFNLFNNPKNLKKTRNQEQC
jgi:hypothetical protein